MLQENIRNFLTKISKKLPLRKIEVYGEPYLNRYYLFGRGRTSEKSDHKLILPWLPFVVYLHHFKSGDKDHALHNHPWEGTSIILAGGYIEEYKNERNEVSVREVKPFQVNRFHENHFHRVVLLEEDAWTLFIAKRHLQDWGFWDPKTKRFTPWYDYNER